MGGGCTALQGGVWRPRRGTAGAARTLLDQCTLHTLTHARPSPPSLPLRQWVFYVFGASAALWLPFWLPLRVATRSGGSSGGGGKSFNLLALLGQKGDGNSSSSALRQGSSSAASGSARAVGRTLSPIAEDDNDGGDMERQRLRPAGSPHAPGGGEARWQRASGAALSAPSPPPHTHPLLQALCLPATTR